jgi:hypothetical protein
MNQLIVITKTSPAERWYFNHINPFNPFTIKRDRLDSGLEIESTCDWLNQIIAKRPNPRSQYFQTLIEYNLLLDIHKSQIKQRFKDRGITLSWKKVKSQLVLFVKIKIEQPN